MTVATMRVGVFEVCVDTAGGFGYGVRTTDRNFQYSFYQLWQEFQASRLAD
jgi:hypothetical protein